MIHFSKDESCFIGIDCSISEDSYLSIIELFEQCIDASCNILSEIDLFKRGYDVHFTPKIVVSCLFISSCCLGALPNFAIQVSHFVLQTPLSLTYETWATLICGLVLQPLFVGDFILCSAQKYQVSRLLWVLYLMTLCRANVLKVISTATGIETHLRAFSEKDTTVYFKTKLIKSYCTAACPYETKDVIFGYDNIYTSIS